MIQQNNGQVSILEQLKQIADKANKLGESFEASALIDNHSEYYKYSARAFKTAFTLARIAVDYKNGALIDVALEALKQNLQDFVKYAANKKGNWLQQAWERVNESSASSLRANMTIRLVDLLGDIHGIQRRLEAERRRSLGYGSSC